MRATEVIQVKEQRKEGSELAELDFPILSVKLSQVKSGQSRPEEARGKLDVVALTHLRSTT